MKTLLALLTIITWLNAGEPLCSYQARLSAQDHKSSTGSKIDKAYGVLQQDRANYYRFNKRDDEDTADCRFDTKEARKGMGKYVAVGKIPQKTLDRILHREPLVEVDVYDDRLDVRLVEEKNKDMNLQEDTSPKEHDIGMPFAQTGQNFAISTLYVTEDHKFLFSGGEGRIVMWDEKTGEEIKTFIGFDNDVLSITVNNGKLYAGDNYGNIGVWDIRTGQILYKIKEEKSKSIKRIVVSKGNPPINHPLQK